MRELKAPEIAARCRITQQDGAWLLPSQNSAAKYRVTLHPAASCTCEDFELRRAPCKHVIAVRLTCERDGAVKAEVPEADAVPKKPTFQQNWPAYNVAQITEKHRFQVLLHDLCGGFHYYQYRRGEFLKHYHQRSNVESTFSAIKRKFGDNVRSRSDTARLNEALAKLVCFNLTRAILSQCELGIEAMFWQNDPVPADEHPAVLPMARPG